MNKPHKYHARPSANKEETTRRNQMLIGLRPLQEAIDAGKEFDKVLIQRGLQGEIAQDVKALLQKEQIPYQLVPAEKLARITSKNHQGIVAYLSMVEYRSLDNVVDGIFSKGEMPLILVLDRITDVRNFGAIARTAECQGAHAILIPSKGSALATSDAMKASAGALNRIPICKTNDLKNTLFYLQQSGLRIIACTEKGNVPLYETNLRGSVAVIMGSEESGITSDLLNMADIKARIPMKGEIASLNVGVAAGMVFYERTRQEIRG